MSSSNIQVLEASLSSFGARATGKSVKPDSVTLMGSVDGITYGAIPADQYLVVLDSALMRQRIIDDSSNFVDWSTYVSWEASYTILNADGTESAYTNELVTGAAANDGLFVLTEESASAAGPDGQIVADFKRFDGLVELLSSRANVLSIGTITLSNGNNNDIDPQGYDVLEIVGPTAAFALTGFIAGDNGRELTVFSHTTQDMKTANQDTHSAANNRILTLVGADLVQSGANHCIAEYYYSAIQTRWILRSHNP